ncbi:unnamed protein product [Aphanomyces euteiches]|uniref:Amino acid transporter transmembrane domain-containing protein n=1 Tax=Aphanomyces euteiches TaxID=100861 RepID=A0A6G0W9Y0_9STRA|nr:hypothetical protein Ae201684_017310 [Aphanomyces euteiches]KAH9081108.1 hypothetical protein Ae201684P_012080 [Aphanomyces euteiches]KAH9145129.1 hypothetical protein AeRB84_010944 [Aphanomyces euteiches]
MDLSAPLLLPTRQSDGATEERKYRIQRDGEELKNTWIDSMFIVIANVVGIGVLGLAHAFAKLGWGWGVICLGGTLAGSLYSGLLMTRMKARVPNAVVFADLGSEAFGNLGYAFITLFANTYIAGVCFSFQLAATLFLQQLSNGLCFVYCAIIVSSIVLPLAQYRNFTEMNAIAVVGAVSIIVPVMLILFDLAFQSKHQTDRAITSWESHVSFDAAVVACMDVIFAMAGHVFFVEIMSEMKEPHDFKKSLVAATSVYSIVYFVVAAAGYAIIGSSASNPITNNLSDGSLRRWCAAFILCHLIVAYVMAVMVLSRAVDQLVFSRRLFPEKIKATASPGGRLAWLGLTSTIILTSFFVCNIVPFVNDLLGFVGAISGVTTTFVFPYLLAPVILSDELSLWHARALRGVAAISSIVAIIGVISSIHRMANSYQTRSPFSC